MFLTELGPSRGWAVLVHDSEKPGSAERLVDSSNERFPTVSPDGQWLAYVANEQGRAEVFVQPYPALDRRIKVTTEGGGEPRWSPDGKNLYYRHQRRMSSIPINARDGHPIGAARRLFEDTYDSDPGAHQHYDIARDGSRFLMLRQQQSAPTEPQVSQHWVVDRLSTFD